MTDASKTLSEDEELLYVLQTVLDWDPTSGVPLPVDPNTRCAAGGSTVLNMLVRVHIPTPFYRIPSTLQCCSSRDTRV